MKEINMSKIYLVLTDNSLEVILTLQINLVILLVLT